MAGQIGFKTVAQLIDQCRQHIAEATAGFWTDPNLLMHINNEQTALMERVLQTSDDYFDYTDTVATVADTQEYDLPQNFVQMNYCEFQDSGDLNEDRIIPPLLQQNKRFPDADLVALSMVRTRYYLRGNKIGFTPTPQSARTVSMNFSRRLMNLQQGTATAGDATTITFPSTPTYGDVSNINDFYNGETIYIVSGTGAGQLRQITDYVGSTRVATVAAWTTNPDTTSVYSIVSSLPPESHDLLAVGAAIRALTKASQKELPSSLTDLYNTLYEMMVVHLERRQVQAPRTVNYLPFSEDD